MESNKTYNWVPMETAVSTYSMMHGQEIELYEGLELAWNCVRNHIRYFKLCNFVLEATPKGKAVRLHTKADFLHSVTLLQHGAFTLAAPSALITTGIDLPKVDGVEYGELPEPRYLEIGDFKDVDYIGDYVDFEFRGDHLHVETDLPVRVLYSTFDVDPELGYPYITEKTAEACAAFIHKIETSRRYYRKEIGIEMKREAAQDFEQMAAEARRGDGLSYNGMDKVLDAMTSWGRKRLDQPFRNATIR